MVAPRDTTRDRLAADTTTVDTLGDTASAGRDTVPLRTRARGPRPFVLSPADSARWPVRGPEPLPGALLPEHRIIAYYGNPRSTRMGIMGQVPPDSMLPRLEKVAMEWALAEPERKVMPALHLIATVAQPKPGPGRKYRLRMSDGLIDTVASWAEERGWIVFLDIQTGHSTVAEEIEPLLPFLERPYVHLALDPEFAMKSGGVPGRRIGTLDAEDVNHAIAALATVVTEHELPPKVLVVHRFTRRMLTNTDSIRLDPRVQVVIQMDGFGSPYIKQDAYRFWISPYPVQYTGFKLFYKNDRDSRTKAPDFEPGCDRVTYELVGCGDDGLMTPEQVIGRLYPVPLYIQYQ
ncbi:lipoprotein [soil metagenome]